MGSNMRVKKQVFQLMAILSLNFDLYSRFSFFNTVTGDEAHTLCRCYCQCLHIKAQISAVKEENDYKYVKHGGE